MQNSLYFKINRIVIIWKIWVFWVFLIQLSVFTWKWMILLLFVNYAKFWKRTEISNVFSFWKDDIFIFWRENLLAKGEYCQFSLYITRKSQTGTLKGIFNENFHIDTRKVRKMFLWISWLYLLHVENIS